MRQRLVRPVKILNCLIILLWVFLEEMPAKIRISSALCIEIISYTARNVILVRTVAFAASSLEGGVVIRNAILTHIACKLSCYDPDPYFHFSAFLPTCFVLLVTRSPLIPSCATRTTTKPPDKSPDGSLDYSAVNYHMPSLCSPQYSTASPFNPLWTASS